MQDIRPHQFLQSIKTSNPLDTSFKRVSSTYGVCPPASQISPSFSWATSIPLLYQIPAQVSRESSDISYNNVVSSHLPFIQPRRPTCNMAQPVAGKSAIITGAGSGLNLELATLLLVRGCNVLFADLSLRPEAKKVIASHAKSSSDYGRAIFQQTDVTSWKQLEEMFVTAEREFGGVDIVCAGAGVFEPVGLLISRHSGSVG